MRIPQFLKFEYDDNGPQLFPTAVAWSLSDGRIKYVIIRPEDDWLAEDLDERLLDDEFFREKGVAPVDVLREMNEDLGETTVFSDGLDPDDQLLDFLCEALGIQAGFELAPMTALLHHESFESLNDRYQDIILRETLDASVAENAVYAQLLLAREEGLTDPDSSG